MDKPLETDVFVDEGSEENVSDTDSSKTGEEDVKAEDFKAKLEEISGREFKSEEDAIKHYKNLASFVGKKEEKQTEETTEEKPEPKTDNSGVNEVMERLDRFEFLTANPEAKEHLDDLIKPIAQANGKTLEEAWEEVKPLVEAKKQVEEQKEVGITSNNRIKPAKNSDVEKLRKQAMKGSADAQENLINAMLGGQM